MAGTNGPTVDNLMAKLAARPYDFDFFWAVRLLQSLHPELPRVGESERLDQDPVRFAQSPSLGFAPATLEEFSAPSEDRAGRLAVRFMGMLGPSGPMPLSVTEYALERQIHHGDRTLTRFLDIFHHRMLSFFYRAWASSQKCVDADRPHHEQFVKYIGSLIGLGMESLRERDAVQDWSKLFFAGRMGTQTRNAEGLEAIIGDYFRIPTQVVSFVGTWLPLPGGSQCRLGESMQTGLLGMSVIVGSNVWDCQMTFRIRLGPMSLADYLRMLPSSESFERLRCWVLNYVGHEYSWEVQFVLRSDEVPSTELGKTGFLGWTTWMKSDAFDHHADDLVVIGG
jgi:type VI secretion system protein ImpH